MIYSIISHGPTKCKSKIANMVINTNLQMAIVHAIRHPGDKRFLWHIKG